MTINEAIAGFLGWLASGWDRIILAFTRLLDSVIAGAWGEIVLMDIGIVCILGVCVMVLVGVFSARGEHRQELNQVDKAALIKKADASFRTVVEARYKDKKKK